jgi:7,8-dihydropterin-6-yl-methyl-4-(beta-D-ribofuranosyl)aminobenzene 5'-phosphate synthase
LPAPTPAATSRVASPSPTVQPAAAQGATTGEDGAPDSSAPAVTITILHDNTAFDKALRADHGFAALVETPEHVLLFDTGASKLTLQNMQTMGIDPQVIEAVVISHYHSDHTGGLRPLWDAGLVAPIYAPPEPADSIRRNAKGRAEVIDVTDALELFPGIYITKPIGVIAEDALVVATPEGSVVLVGCSHPGPEGMAEMAQEVVPGKIALLAGGYHLSGYGEDVMSLGAKLTRMGVERVMPTHCTGKSAIDALRADYGDRCLEGGVGRRISIPSAGG